MWTKQLAKEDWEIEAKVYKPGMIEEMEARRSEDQERRAVGTGVTAVSCTSWAVVKQQGINLEVRHLRCKMWTCQRCAPRRKNQLKWVARNGFPSRFITLTAAPESGDTREARARSLVRAWREVRRRYKKQWESRKIEFLAIFEKTQGKEPHLHILIRSEYIPQKWLSRQMDSLTGSPIVDIRRIKNRAMAANYVSKYIAKDPTRFKGSKRYWRSLGWLLNKKRLEEKEEEFPSKWYMIRQRPRTFIPVLVKKGFRFLEMENSIFGWWYGTGPPPSASNWV